MRRTLFIIFVIRNHTRGYKEENTNIISSHLIDKLKNQQIVEELDTMPRLKVRAFFRHYNEHTWKILMMKNCDFNNF